MVCTSGGDPHNNDFFGNWWDLQHGGTYYLVNYGDFIVQGSSKQCRNQQGWSAGNLIYCNYEFAVQLQQGHVLRVGTKWGTTWPQSWSMRPPTINGGSFLNQHKSFNGGVSARCWGGGTRYACQIDSPDILVRLNTAPPYNYYTITFKKRGGKFVAAGRASGLCGGLGMQQYHNHIGRKFPCKTCKRGGAVGTVICKCEEWQVPQSKSLVSEYLHVTARKDPHPERAQLAQTATTSKLVPNSDAAAVEEDVKLCTKALEAAKTIKEVLDDEDDDSAVKKLTEYIKELEKDCGLDVSTTGGSAKQVSKEAKILEAEFCDEVREMALADKPSTLYCKFAVLCAKEHPDETKDGESVCAQDQ
jgi:hypothetical protein